MNKSIVVESFNMEFQIPQLPGYYNKTRYDTVLISELNCWAWNLYQVEKVSGHL